MKSFILILILKIPLILFAQRGIIVSGNVKDAATGELLIGANIVIANQSIGIQSNNYGFYSIKLNIEAVQLKCSYIGYQTYTASFKAPKDTVLNIYLSIQDTLSVLEVTADKNKNIKTTQTSLLNIPIKQLTTVPTLIGEKDLFKSMQLLPGIQFGQEGTSGLFVRGGSPDQNLILLDDVPMYNVSHLYGFFSIFNTDAIKSADVCKGGFQAQYGGRLSSVIDIRTKDGNMSKWQGNAGIGVLSVNGNIEGPIISDKLSVFLSGRRSLLDLWTLPVQNAKADAGKSSNNWGYFFYDFNFKANYIYNDKNRFYVSVYNGKDKNKIQSSVYEETNGNQITQEGANGTAWGNTITSLRWNKVFNNKLFGNMLASINNYKFSTFAASSLTKWDSTESITTESKYDYLSSIQDIMLKQDFDYYLNTKNHIRFGALQSLKIFKPGVEITSIRENKKLDTLLNNPNKITFNFAAYAQDELELSEKIKINAGIRYDFFQSDGFHTHNFQPRLSVRSFLNKTTSIKFAYSTITQDLHLLTNSTAGLPTDLWLPASKNAKPERSEQITLGVFKNFEKKGWETSVEGYYKTLKGIIEYKEGASFLNTLTGWEDKIEVGEGKSYGVEFFLHKKEGKVNGWISYTLSWNNRQFPNINNGNIFPFRYDRRHYLNIFLNKILRGGKRNISLAFVLASGNAVSLPTDKYQAANNVVNGVNGFTNFYDQESYRFGNVIFVYPQRNNFRMRTYNRLDFNYNYVKERKNFIRTFSIGIYNVLFYRNPYFLIVSDKDYNWRISPDFKREIVVKEVSLFNFIPSLGLSYKFK
jgi:outer membrane receptor for ferrienterochelin and colicin